MDCHHVRDQLALLATGDVTEAERARLRAHLARCPACREVAEDYRTLVAEVRSADRPVDAAPQTVGRVQATVAAAIRAERRRWRARRGLRLAGALAAAVVLGVAVGYLVQATDDRAAAPDPDRERWRYEGALAERTSPLEDVVVHRDRLYVVRRGRSGTAVVAIDAAAGAPVWETPLPRPARLAADGEHVYCVASGTGGPELRALHAADGRPAWRCGSRSGGVMLRPSRPVPLAGDRVAWTVGRAVRLLDARTGRSCWSRPIPDEGPLSQVAVGEGLYVATCRAVYGLVPETGQPRWRRAFSRPMALTMRPLLAAGGGRMYVAGAGRRGGRLLCLDRRTGRVLWRRDVPRPRHLLAGAGYVYLRGRDVRALAGGSGEAVWRCRAEGCGPLTREDGLLRFVDTGRRGRVVALNERTGRTAWQMAGIRSCGAFLTAGDTGYVKTWDGVVHAIALGVR